MDIIDSIRLILNYLTMVGLKIFKITKKSFQKQCLPSKFLRFYWSICFVEQFIVYYFFVILFMNYFKIEKDITFMVRFLFYFSIRIILTLFYLNVYVNEKSFILMLSQLNFLTSDKKFWQNKYKIIWYLCLFCMAMSTLYLINEIIFSFNLTHYMNLKTAITYFISSYNEFKILPFLFLYNQIIYLLFYLFQDLNTNFTNLIKKKSENSKFILNRFRHRYFRYKIRQFRSEYFYLNDLIDLINRFFRTGHLYAFLSIFVFSIYVIFDSISSIVNSSYTSSLSEFELDHIVITYARFFLFNIPLLPVIYLCDVTVNEVSSI